MTERTKVLFGKVKEYLDSREWIYREETFGDLLAAVLPFKFDGFVCYAFVTVSDSEIQTMTHWWGEVPEAYRAAVGEYLHRASYGQMVGKWEIDLDSGRLHFHTFLSCMEGIPSQQDIKRIVDEGFETFQTHCVDLFELTNGRGTPAELLKKG